MVWFCGLLLQHKGDTLEASKAAHPFELNTGKPMHCTGVNQCPLFGFKATGGQISYPIQYDPLFGIFFVLVDSF